MNVVVPFVAEPDVQRVDVAIETARTAQHAWAAQSLPSRLKIIRRARSDFADHATELALTANGIRQRPISEILTAEVLPLVEACRFLERESARLLRTRIVGRCRRPLWLTGVRSEIRREPHGVVLVIGASNYPIFLPAVQMLQAVVAGNAVVMKPGDGGSTAAQAVIDTLQRAGMPRDLIQLLPENASAAKHAILSGVDKVIFTGSAETGESVLTQCAATITPATVELSGCDAMFVRADADLDLVASAIGFGLRLNGGATCIAPRRAFVHRDVAAELESRLRSAISGTSEIQHPLLLRCLTEALVSGAGLIHGSIKSDGWTLSVPIVLRAVTPSMRIAREDIFAPVISLIQVGDDAEALAFSSQCPYALGATIFSRDENAARNLATKVRAGNVVINDLIVPTADPRLPFGGRGRSGFGSTRGAEGLLEMTVPKVVSTRCGKSRHHFEEPKSGDARLFAAYIRAIHGGGLGTRVAALVEMCRAIGRRDRK